MVYLLWLTFKEFNSTPVTISHHKPAKIVLFDWTTPWKFFIFIIQFFQGETDQVCGTSFMLSSLVKFGQILPIGSTHFGFFFSDFHWFALIFFWFHQNIVSFDWVMNDFLSCMTFCCQNRPFPVESFVFNWNPVILKIFC